MTERAFLPDLPATWAATRATLHPYVQAIGVVPRALAPAHPKWWHVSLKVRPTGLVTDPVSLPGGGSLWFRMDLVDHAVHAESSAGDRRVLALTEGLTGTAFGDAVLEIAHDFGLDADFARDRFESDDPAAYDPRAAEVFWHALVNVDGVFAAHQADLPGETGIVQVWPHGFDLATEWFAGTEESWTHGDESGTSPRQINLGFFPGEDAYFYSNPWPFHGDQLRKSELPQGARWTTDTFEGSILPYEELVGDDEAARKLREYARAVWEAAAPTLRSD